MSLSFWAITGADLHRVNGKSSVAAVLLAALTRRTYRPLFTLRLCQALAGHPVLRALTPLAAVVHRAARHLAGIDLPWRVRMAPGVRIDHGWSLVVNAGAVLGGNVTLFHGVTLGQRDEIAADGSRQTKTPVIEDDVWIGPHAIVVGGVTVGRGSRIAGGAFVTDSVPPGSLVLGNPARIVRSDVRPDVDNRWTPPAP